MCDASSRNTPEALETILANCNAHARRRFGDVEANFPEECGHVLDVFREVYRNDAAARRQRMTAEQRLAFHQAESGPRMAELEKWMRQKLDDHEVEPNSGLGQAMEYMLGHWEGFTLFLRVAGAPLVRRVNYSCRSTTTISSGGTRLMGLGDGPSRGGSGGSP
jgi:transposase